MALNWAELVLDLAVAHRDPASIELSETEPGKPLPKVQQLSTAWPHGWGRASGLLVQVQ